MDLNLQPGELVRVKSFDEILDTIDWDYYNRGLRWDAEMVPHCGRIYRVQKRVKRSFMKKPGKCFSSNPSRSSWKARRAGQYTATAVTFVPAVFIPIGAKLDGTGGDQKSAGISGSSDSRPRKWPICKGQALARLQTFPKTPSPEDQCAYTSRVVMVTWVISDPRTA